MAAQELNIKLKTLIFKKEYLFSKLQKVYDLSTTLSKRTNKEFLMQVAQLENIKLRYEDTVMQIVEVEAQINPNAKISFKDLESFDTLYSACQMVALKLQPETSTSDKSTEQSRPSLPKLKLFEFDGQLENWMTFYDTFSSLVHERNYDNIDKFHYLLSCVKGQALNIVKKLPISAANYPVVWKSLVDKYQDNRALVNKYLDKMINFTPLTKDTSVNLTLFIETFDHSLKAIEALNIENLSDYLFCHLALRGLDNYTKKLFEESRDPLSIPTFSELIAFVNKQIKVLDHTFPNPSQSSSLTKQITHKPNNNYGKQFSRPSFSKTSLTASAAISNKNYSKFSDKLTCSHCNQNHMIYRCEQFRKLPVEKRIDRVNSLNLCKNCLKGNHDFLSCKSTMSCGVCASPHHYLLHIDANPRSVVPTRQINTADGQASLSHSQNALVSSRSVSEENDTAIIDKCIYGVVLGTVRLHAKDKCGQLLDCRAVIDSGAQCSFITMDCAQRLGLPRKKCPYTIAGLGGEQVRNHGMITCQIKPRNSSQISYSINLIIVSKVASEMPSVNFTSEVIELYKKYNLADPYFYRRSHIDILLGNDIVMDLIKDKPLSISPDIPQVIQTAFGFIVSGKLYSSNLNELHNLHLSVSYEEEQLLDKTLRKFWEVEELPCKPSTSPLDQLAEDIFVNEHSRDISGRYIVPLPFIPNPPELGESYSIAERRLRYTERKLARNPVLQRTYADFMREYESLDHMEEYHGNEPSRYVIPHHSILRPDSTSTPLRVVFDCSSRTSNNLSLNEILLTGPTLYQQISTIILNFRLFQYALVSDVCKMYRAIFLRKRDRCYQHILYRESPNDPIKLYELKTVTYGLNCSPFLAMRTLQQLVHDEGNRFPFAVPVVREGIFMDDILYSINTFEDACTLQDELISLFRCGGFELKKWASNSRQLLERVPDEHRELPITFMKDDNECTIKVLGLKWFPMSDKFYFVVNKTDNINTKRSVLKLLASIYDPVGFVSPCIFTAKALIQDLWKLNVGWDEQLPLSIAKRWSAFISELPRLKEMEIERHMLLPGQTECEIVGFCDASLRGYAACIYVISRDGSQTKVRLIIAKSKVAPVKPLTIPRLELMAALLLSKMLKYVEENLHRIKINRITALTDSTIVLSWLQIEAYKLKTFVSNRVTQITDNIPLGCWQHVQSENNMADICSRGATPCQLLTISSQWLCGPSWLYTNPEQWPVAKLSNGDLNNIPELKKEGLFSLIVTGSTSFIVETKLEFCERLFSQFSCFTKLVRTLSRILRLVRSKRKPTVGSILTTAEFNETQDVLVRLVQSTYFSKEISDLNNNIKYIPSMKTLSPFIDEQGFLRVGGRISHSDLPYNAKHPRLLPKESRFTILLVSYYHIKYLHVGPRALQNIIIQNFWILSARRLIRSVLAKCKPCFKNNPTLLQPEMAPLPAARLLPNKIFDHVGVDLGGPFFIKESLRRNARIERAYVALFICYSTKAVHLEVISSLSADCFLTALDRFTARRGLCSVLYSDCGTNFIAANKYLTEIEIFFRDKSNQDKIIEGCVSKHLVWKFNPPSAPHMGGLWEAGIKAAKYHLKRAVGEKSLTFEELSTVFCKVEAILNSRPLCPLPASDDPNEFNVLTPGHLLIGKGLVSVPEYNVEDVSLTRLTRWQYMQRCTQQFWNRWRVEYINTLQQRAKWFTSSANIHVGDIVIIKVDNVPPCNWPLARIEKLHPGPDGIVRCVTLRTQKNILQRPVNKLAPLPYVN